MCIKALRRGELQQLMRALKSRCSTKNSLKQLSNIPLHYLQLLFMQSAEDSEVGEVHLKSLCPRLTFKGQMENLHHLQGHLPVTAQSLPVQLISHVPATQPESLANELASRVDKTATPSGAFSRLGIEALPPIQGRGVSFQGKSMKRSFSDPCSTETPASSRAKRHSRCMTEAAVIRRPAKLPESRLKSMVQAAKPPMREKRRHKRVQSIDVTNDPTSCKLVASL